jgi:4,5-DOPA dioxygenase extradiol
MVKMASKFPALFIGHGSPTNAIEDNEFTGAWIENIKSIPVPEGIVCISAHWKTDGTFVTITEKPETIYDFHGFPEPLYHIKYPAPGSPEIADLISKNIKKVQVLPDNKRGLDHGAWAILCKMFPEANIPVIQVSLDCKKEPDFHYELAKELKFLREKGILIIGSGNIVHNLKDMIWGDRAYEWAIAFDENIKELILSLDHKSIINYERIGRSADLSVPTAEHFLPLIYILALQDKDDKIGFFAERVTLGSISMTSLKIG